VDGTVMKVPPIVYVFAGETMTVRAAPGQDKVAAFSLESESHPKILVVQHGSKPDRTPYELDGDTLRVAIPTPDEHPTNVSDKGHMLFILKRTPPK
jgi:uncharacterized protein (TIGR03067 family)